MGFRSRVRRGLEWGLTSLRIDRLARRRLSGRVLVVAYHNIVPRGERAAGERALHLDQEMFGAQLDLLQASHEVIPISRVGDLNHEQNRPRAVITWDDAYRGAVTAGVAEVTKRGLAATIFACPGRLGGAAFWWDRWAAAAEGVLPAALRRRALEEWQGDEAVISREGGDMEVPSLPAHAHPATLDELRAAVDRPGITIGSHSWSHPNLTRVAGDRLEHELADSLAWLRERFPGQHVPWLSYPYGLNSPSVQAHAAAVGYQGALVISGGWVPHQVDRYSLPRLNVSAGLSLQGFALRLAGLFCR